MRPRRILPRAVWHDERMIIRAGIALRLLEDALRWMVLLFRSSVAVPPRKVAFDYPKKSQADPRT